jgi:phosphatidylglycerophosphate synthase
VSERAPAGVGPTSGPAGAAVLVILPAGGQAPPPETVVGGLGLAARLVRVGHRAGFTRVVVHPSLSRHVRVEDGAVTLLGEPGASAPTAPGSRTRVVLVAASVVPSVAWLGGLRGDPVAPEQIHLNPATAMLVETDRPGAALDAALRGASLRELDGALRELFPAPPRSLPDLADAGRIAVGSGADVARAEAWLLRGLVKEHEGFMSRHFERRVSLAISRRLAPTGITPNAMTVVSLAVGLASAGFFLSPAAAWQLCGALIFLAHSILDGCDGELARLKLMESPGGARLDFWGDNVVHVAVFACMAVGWSRAADSSWPLLLGALAVGATLTAATVLARRPPAPAAGRGEMVDSLANRDFIYLVIALATLGKAAWFLVFVAVGTPLFILLALRRRRA